MCHPLFARLLGVLGGAILATGACVPLIYIPLAGDVSYLHHPSYFGAGNLGEVVILAAGGLSVVFALFNYSRLLWFTGISAFAQLIATLAWFEHSAAAVFAQADRPDLIDPGLMWASAALQHARFEWGPAIIAGGAVMVLAAAACETGGRSRRT